MPAILFKPGLLVLALYALAQAVRYLRHEVFQEDRATRQNCAPGKAHMGIFSSAASFLGFGSGQNGKDEEAGEARPKPTVLVIDDDTKFLQTMRIVLGDAGYGVLTSASGPKGLDMLRYAPRDVGLVLLDFGMPRFSGSDTLEYLRKLNDRVKVIGISGYSPNELPANFQEGVQRVITKPFSNSDLLQTIEDVLAQPTAAQPAVSVLA
jgi:CheY-like chemotaxis protein